MVDIITSALKAARSSTGVWAVIVSAVSVTAVEVFPEVVKYFVAGDYVMGTAYGVGLLVAVVTMAVIIETFGEKLVVKEE